MEKILKDIARSLKSIDDSLKKMERQTRTEREVEGDITINGEIKDGAELEELIARIGLYILQLPINTR